MKLIVYPTTKESLVVKHPVSGPLNVGGSEWQFDGFTARMLTDRIITRDKGAGYSPAPALDQAITEDLNEGTPKIMY